MTSDPKVCGRCRGQAGPCARAALEQGQCRAREWVRACAPHSRRRGTQTKPVHVRDVARGFCFASFSMVLTRQQRIQGCLWLAAHTRSLTDAADVSLSFFTYRAGCSDAESASTETSVGRRTPSPLSLAALT
eukprot:6188067-Pleurochrysis_carterae.AAC.6